MLQPEDFLDFIHSGPFERSWQHLGLDDETDLAALQLIIVADPRGPPLVAGTGGLRKLRFAPEKWKTGKRGAVRVCYAYFEDFGIVYLVYAYGKNDKDTLTAQEKKAIKAMIERVEQGLRRRKRLK